MSTCLPSHGSRHSCPRWVNAGNKNTPSMHHPRRWNATTSMVGLKNSHIHKHLTQNCEPQRYSWGTQKKKNTSQCCCFCCVKSHKGNFVPKITFNKHSYCDSRVLKIYSIQLFLPCTKTKDTRSCHPYRQQLVYVCT